MIIYAIYPIVNSLVHSRVCFVPFSVLQHEFLRAVVQSLSPPDSPLRRSLLLPVTKYPPMHGESHTRIGTMPSSFSKRVLRESITAIGFNMHATNTNNTHPLRNEYCFWRTIECGTNVSVMGGRKQQKEEYEHGLQSLGSCKTVEEFWKLYCSLPVIGAENAWNYSFFKVGASSVFEGLEGNRTAVGGSRECEWRPYHHHSFRIGAHSLFVGNAGNGLVLYSL